MAGNMHAGSSSSTCSITVECTCEAQTFERWRLLRAVMVAGWVRTSITNKLLAVRCLPDNVPLISLTLTAHMFYYNLDDCTLSQSSEPVTAVILSPCRLHKSMCPVPKSQLSVNGGSSEDLYSERYDTLQDNPTSAAIMSFDYKAPQANGVVT
jgi:hypothetical protein